MIVAVYRLSFWNLMNCITISFSKNTFPDITLDQCANNSRKLTVIKSRIGLTKITKSLDGNYLNHLVKFLLLKTIKLFWRKITRRHCWIWRWKQERTTSRPHQKPRNQTQQKWLKEMLYRNKISSRHLVFNSQIHSTWMSVYFFSHL